MTETATSPPANPETPSPGNESASVDDRLDELAKRYRTVERIRDYRRGDRETRPKAGDYTALLQYDEELALKLDSVDSIGFVRYLNGRFVRASRLTRRVGNLPETCVEPVEQRLVKWWCRTPREVVLVDDATAVLDGGEA